MKQNKGRPPRWYRLDNAAQIYPAIKEKNWTSVFRLSVMLREKVCPDSLFQAAQRTAERFPLFCVRLRPGLFWYYFEENTRPLPPPMEDVSNPCGPFRWQENNGYLFRIYYYESRISVEFFHSLTDGFGASQFLLTLCGEYLRLRGYETGEEEGLGQSDPSEWEDAYGKYASSRYTKSWSESAAYHFHGTSFPAGKMSIIEGIVPTSQLLAKARELKVTITEYLAAELIMSFQQLQYTQQPKISRQKAVKIQIPVNLRSFFPTRTLRNFSLYLHVGIQPQMGSHTMEETLRQVHHTLRMRLNEKELNALMTQNVKTERNRLVRPIPLFLKNMVMAQVYRRVGDRINSAVLSNLGPVLLPEQTMALVERFEFMLGPSKIKTPNLAVATLGEQTALTFTSALRETDVERVFFCRLVEAGIPVLVESNRM